VRKHPVVFEEGREENMTRTERRSLPVRSRSQSGDAKRRSRI
jgi:hypothetical protein